jgi:hypothetical protein
MDNTSNPEENGAAVPTGEEICSDGSEIRACARGHGFRGRRCRSGLGARGQATGAGAGYPNVVEEVPSHLQIQNDHQKEWLRFSTTHINLGPGNLQIRGGGQIAPCTIDGIDYDQCTVATQEVLDSAGNVALTHPAGVAFFHPEHNHWHQSAVAAFKIATGDPASPGGCSQTACGTEIAAGVKIIFASSTSSSPASPARRRRLCRGATSSATAIFRASRPAGPTSTTNRRPCRSSR